MKSTGQWQSEINEETYKTNVTKTQKTKRWKPKQLDDTFRKLGKTANEINYAPTEYIRYANKYNKYKTGNCQRKLMKTKN